MVWKHVDCQNTFSHAWPLCLKRLWELSVPLVKPSVLSPTSEETPIKYIHVCFPPTRPYTKTFAGLRVDLLSYGPIKKFTNASFFTDILARLNISNMTSQTKSCQYLNPESSLQWMMCSPNVSNHALRQTGQTSSSRNKGIISRYLRIIRYSTDDICWPRP